MKIFYCSLSQLRTLTELGNSVVPYYCFSYVKAAGRLNEVCFRLGGQDQEYFVSGEFRYGKD